jgi:chromate transporter
METIETPAQEQSVASYSLWHLVLYNLKLGTLGFGGPVALVGYMHRDLVEQRRWITDADYKEGLALAQLAPGPLAAQLAIYLGYVHYRILGATLIGLAFVLPSFLMVVALGFVYQLYGGLPWIRAAFYGVGAGVIGIIAYSAYKLTTKTIGKDWLLWAIYLTAATITIITEAELIVLFLIAGIIVWLVKAPPKFLRKGTTLASFFAAPLALALAAVSTTNWGKLWDIFTFFLKAGAFVFGSGLAIIPFLYGVVKDYHWLTNQQFVDAIAVALITPGPVVITAAFIGFLVAGFLGASIAGLATFLPCYLFTIILAPYFKKYGKRPGLAAFIKGVTAAAIGAITGAVVVLGRRSIIDLPTMLLLLVTILLLWRAKQIPEPLIVLGAAIVGLIVYPLLHA